jgi:methylmalonyl-CoA mutase
VGVNTFLAEHDSAEPAFGGELIRSTEAEKRQQLEAVEAFKARHLDTAAAALARLQQAAVSGENTFAALMHTARHATLGQMSQALYQVGGQYRRSM